MCIAFIYSFEQSHWKSCQTITRNLLENYELSLKNQKSKHFNFNSELTNFQTYELAEEIFNSSPKQLIIVDHRPHIYLLLRYIDDFFSQNKKLLRPEIIIHVFGDFTLFGKEWLLSEPYLTKFKVKFICASDKQVDLVSKFLKNKKNGLYKHPFPVDSKQFYFSQKIRDVQRKKLNIPDDQIVFLYTGRMSLQKKVIELTIDFLQLLKLTNVNAVLYLAGDFDDLGNPFTGIYYKNGEFNQRFIKIMNSIDSKYKKNIQYIGNLNEEELLHFYNASDLYISMSAHNDEDYGMSPAEAICTGLPAILSDWAGYSSFKIQNINGCTLIPTKIDEENFCISYDRVSLLKNLILSTKKINNLRDSRQQFSKTNNDHFSITANEVSLRKIFNDDVKKFNGFTPYMTKLAAAFKKNRPPFIHSTSKSITTTNIFQTDKPPFFRSISETTTTTKNKYNLLYRNIYESYLSK